MPAPDAAASSAAAAHAFRTACELDVSVRKPGNVSRASPGHRMTAALFSASAAAAAPALCRAGARVGERIEAAMVATWAAAGCNTNLGILLLCAPVAAAAERARVPALPTTPTALRSAVGEVLAGLDRDDAAAAFRAIALAHPAGLGNAPAEDVHAAPTVDLRAAMALAADRDRVARQYRDGLADLFDLGLTALGSVPSPDDVTAAVQRLYLALLTAFADSHIERKWGAAPAREVMREAAPWLARAQAGDRLDADPAWAAWDAALKQRGINPGTTADLTVATLMIAGLIGRLPAFASGAPTAALAFPGGSC